MVIEDIAASRARGDPFSGSGFACSPLRGICAPTAFRPVLYAHHSGYHAIANHIQGRIDALSADIQRDLVIELKDVPTSGGNVGRRFDNRWLSQSMHFFS